MIAAGDESRATGAIAGWELWPSTCLTITLDSSLIAGASNKLRNGNSGPRHRARAMSAELLAGNDRLIQRNCRGCPLALAPTTQPNAH